MPAAHPAILSSLRASSHGRRLRANASLSRLGMDRTRFYLGCSKNIWLSSRLMRSPKPGISRSLGVSQTLPSPLARQYGSFQLLGVPDIEDFNIMGLYWGPPIQRNYHHTRQRFESNPNIRISAAVLGLPLGGNDTLTRGLVLSICCTLQRIRVIRIPFLPEPENTTSF